MEDNELPEEALESENAEDNDEELTEEIEDDESDLDDVEEVTVELLRYLGWCPVRSFPGWIVSPVNEPGGIHFEQCAWKEKEVMLHRQNLIQVTWDFIYNTKQFQNTVCGFITQIIKDGRLDIWNPVNTIDFSFFKMENITTNLKYVGMYMHCIWFSYITNVNIAIIDRLVSGKWWINE